GTSLRVESFAFAQDDGDLLVRDGRTRGPPLRAATCMTSATGRSLNTRLCAGPAAWRRVFKTSRTTIHFVDGDRPECLQVKMRQAGSLRVESSGRARRARRGSEP